MTIRSACTLLFASALSTAALAQDGDPCATWMNLGKKAKDQAETNHSLYRDQVKAKNFEAAFPLWKAVYDVAPAADGKRSLHYSDGRDIYLAKFNAATDEAEKEEYSDMIMRLYEENHKCYPAESKALYSNQVYNMFYVLKRPYEELYEVIAAAREMSGEKTDFRMLAPMGYVTNYLYTSEKIDADEARTMIEDARAIAKANMSGPSGDQYQQAMETHDAAVKGIEPYVFDCDYFMPEFETAYGELAPGDITAREDLVRRMLGANCERASNDIVQKLDAEISQLRLEEYERNNPMSVANKLYEEGRVDEALAKYEEVAATADPQLQGSIYLQMASVYNVQGQKGQARNYARKAAAARPGWGKPYLLIGDLYASSSRSCSSDPFKQRVVILAALNQYARAKSDPETSGDAQERINRYSGSAPTKEMMFERGLKSGSSASTGCWVGETVTLP